VRAAEDEAEHLVGLSILSRGHASPVAEVMPYDAEELKRLGVAAVFTPKDFRLNAIMRDIVQLTPSASVPCSGSRCWP
jgi:(2R)-ethylmalonyl-CoA mutase